MPLVRISMLKGKSAQHVQAVCDAVHDALVERYDMDPRDRFQVVEELEPGRLLFDRDYAGGPRSDDFVLIGIRSRSRAAEMKEAFYRRLVERLAEKPGLRPQDVFVHLDCTVELVDLSFANGVSAAELAKRYGRDR
jgi:phenylpyruvate tautomerase PptA (4-oxalocrotonate tautomerase family)